jgi:hypothetical protein
MGSFVVKYVSRLEVDGEQEPRNHRDVKAVTKPSSAQQLLSLHRAPFTFFCNWRSHGEPPILPKSSAPFIFVDCLRAIGGSDWRILGLVEMKPIHF